MPKVPERRAAPPEHRAGPRMRTCAVASPRDGCTDEDQNQPEERYEHTALADVAAQE